MSEIEHPDVTKIDRTGYANTVAQPEHCGIDFYDNEVLVGDSIILLPNSEMLLEENLEDYLIEHLEFQFITAK